LFSLSGIVFMIISIIGFFNIHWLFIAIIFSSLLQVSAALIFGSSHIPVYGFVQILIFIRLIMIVLIRKKVIFRFESFNQKYTINILFFFVFFAILSAFVLPNIFSGLEIFDPNISMEAQYGSSSKGILELKKLNLSQSVYLFLNFITFIFLIEYVNKVKSKIIINIFIFTLFFIIVTFIYQFNTMFINVLGFPKIDIIEGFLYNNPSFALLNHSAIGDIPRLSGSFLESSTAGLYLSALSSGFVAITLTKEGNIKFFLVSIISIVALLTTTSTTGYLSFIITLFFLFLLYLYGRIKGKTIFSKQKVLSLNIFIGVFIVLLFINYMIFSDILDSILINKMESSSYIVRTYANNFALDIFNNTYFLGAGLGSNRPSGFLYSLLSNLGIITFLFIIFLFILYLQILNKIVYSFDLLSIFSFSFSFSILVGMFLSIPDINTPYMWCSLGILAGVIFKSNKEVN
jgi:hypothetical protein